MKENLTVFVEKLTGKNQGKIADFKSFKQAFKWVENKGYKYTGVASLYSKGRSILEVHGETQVNRKGFYLDI